MSDFPRWPGFSKKAVDLEDVDAQMKEVIKQIEEFEERANNGDEDAEVQKNSFTGYVFVVLKKPADQLKVMEA